MNFLSPGDNPVTNTGNIRVVTRNTPPNERQTLSNATAHCGLYLKLTGEITMAIIGNNGNNVLNGGKGNDLIKGLDGDDVLNGKDGNDTLIGDKGSDKSNGGNGHDTIVWNNGDGSDFNDGGNGNDVQEVNGGNGDEKFTLKAGGQDFLFDRVTAVAFTLDDKNIEKLELNGNGGNDSFKVDSLAGTDLKEVWFNGGKGMTISTPAPRKSRSRPGAATATTKCPAAPWPMN